MHTRVSAGSRRIHSRKPRASGGSSWPARRTEVWGAGGAEGPPQGWRHGTAGQTHLQTRKTDTLESKRVERGDALSDGEGEVYEEIRRDELGSAADPDYVSKTLIVTGRKSSKETCIFARELASLFPHSTLARRDRRPAIREIAEHGIRRGYTGLVFVTENRKKPDGLVVIHLPSGPTFYFAVSSIASTASIQGHGRATSHVPEVITNNFATPLGRAVESLLCSLFPAQADLEGRQVVTLHNQRDFIFVRRHRYVFKSEDRVGLQELGPRFTLRLRRILRGIHGREPVDLVFQYRPGAESSRSRFWLG